MSSSSPPGFEHPVHLSQGALGLADRAQREGGQHSVEVLVGEGQLFGAALGQSDAGHGL